MHELFIFQATSNRLCSQQGVKNVVCQICSVNTNPAGIADAASFHAKKCWIHSIEEIRKTTFQCLDDLYGSSLIHIYFLPLTVICLLMGSRNENLSVEPKEGKKVVLTWFRLVVTCWKFVYLIYDFAISLGQVARINIFWHNLNCGPAFFSKHIH